MYIHMHIQHIVYIIHSNSIYYVQPYTALNSRIQSYTALCSPIQSYTALYNTMQPYTTLCSPIQPSAALSYLFYLFIILRQLVTIELVTINYKD